MVKTSSSSATQKRKPRLLWANPYCLLDTSSGASMTVRQMLLQLVARGYEVQVLGATVFDDLKGMGRLQEQFPDLNAHLHQLIEAEDGPLTHQLVVSYSHNRNHFTTHEEGLWYGQYLYMLDSFKPDVVWFYGGLTMDMLIADEARDRGIPVAFYLANGSYKSPRWCRDVDLILSDSQATADMYRKEVGFAAKPVGKFIAPENFIAENHERKRLLFVNPSWQKGASIFVQLAEKLERERPDIELEVVEARADWPAVLRETTRQMGGQRSALSNVVVTPNTNDMRGPYSRARLVVAPSLWWESSGRMLAEAMLNGIPALITNRGGMPEMIGNAGIAFDFPVACYEEPYQHLLSDEELQPLLNAVIRLFDGQDLYQEYVDRAWQVGKEKHSLERSTERLVNALTPLINLRAGNKDFAIAQKKRHRQNLIYHATKPDFKVDNSFQQLVSAKPLAKFGDELQAPRLYLTDDFTWQLKGKVVVLDNRASLIRKGLADQMAETKAFGIVAFDPASEVKNAKKYEGSEYIQLFQHALLGSGGAITLHACVAPELTSTLTPLSAEKLPKRHHLGAKLLAELPINSIALDSIEGLDSLDWLILDELSDAMAVLENGKKSLTDTLLIQARVAFQLTHEHQPSLAELQHWASHNGFRFYRFHNIRHYSHLPEKLNARNPYATEQESGDALFLPSHERMAALSDENKTKLAFILSAGFAAHDMAFDLMADVNQEKALEFLEGQGLLPKAPTPLVTQNRGNKDFQAAQLKQTDVSVTSTFIPAAENTPQLESKRHIDLELLKKQLSEVLNHLAIFELTQGYAAKVVELAEKLRWVNDKSFVQKAIEKIYSEFSKKKGSIAIFYILTNALLNSQAKVFDSKNVDLLEERLEASGWKGKAALYSFWLESIQDDRLPSQSKEFTVIVICNKYKKETYENIVELRRQCGVDGEIIFVNNGDKSNDARGLASLVEVYIELIGNSGAYLARNIGSVFANGGILIFVDDDGLPEKGMLSAHADIHKQYTLDSVRGSYLPKNPNETPPSHYHLGDKALVTLNCLEGNCSYRRDLFFKVRGWGDYILFGHGGAELYVRLISNGSDQSKHIYIPGCILRHDYYRGEKHARNKRKKQAESAYVLSALDCAINPMVSGYLSHEVNDEKTAKSAVDNKKCLINRLVYLDYPLIYGVELAGRGVKLALENTESEIKVINGSNEIINEIALADKNTMIFTGHSFYNLTMKSPPYIQQDTNVFDIFNVVPFAVVDDHAYADFMLQRCKKAPQEIIMGSTSADLLDEFEAVSISKKVHKINIPSKSPEVDSVPFEEKQTRAVFLGKLYDNIPKDKASLESKVLSDNRLTENDKALILEMINGRERNPFFSLHASELYVSDLSLLYYDLVDKFYRNFYRNQELGRIACAFKKHGIPVHVIGGEESGWSFKEKKNCIFWPKMEYKEAIIFLHNSKYNINLTPSYSDVLTGRAIDMMGSNALCVSDYSPYYEKLEKEVIYFDSDFIGSNDFFEENSRKLASMQKEYIHKIFGKEKIKDEWRECIYKAYEILNKKTVRDNGESIGEGESFQKTKEVVTDFQLQKIKDMHAAEIERLKGKEKLRVVFLVIHRSVWKVDAVFQKMLSDPIFDPIVLVCPDLNKKNDALTFSEINETYAYFKDKGYKVFSSWMKNKKQWRSLDSLKPDLLFFTNPHGLTHPEYYDKAFSRFLACYVPYTYQVARFNKEYELDYNRVFHNSAWKIYAPHEESLKISRQYADNQGSNVVVTGYPLVENLLASGSDVHAWKKQKTVKKKIIWAPHHTVGSKDEALPFSNFEKLSGFMMKLADHYKDQVQWAFKPHPLLKEKLYQEASWGKEMTENYYSYWACSEHTQLEEGDYQELFRASDALVHDSVSFLAEYLVLDKPVMFVINKDVELVDFLTPFGINAFNASHHGVVEEDVTKFVESILNNEDVGKEERKLFLYDNLDGEKFDSPSKNIIDDLKGSLFS
ncbi:glycosyltransferase [Halomonas sp. AOP13-D3-9]